ncbi:MAG: hypothetical protein A3F68_04810 [Acidobacteria bacterium RIFCSPLOWO2_12_FULL_54_10]|nr:MAG: hypothetical protein A3F68_04810 [Acidobacteria bacterium RIFCSPLOWO2_12_FULL_54_10]
MSEYWPLILIGAVALALLIWSLVAQHGRNQAQKAELQQLGFQPCPEQKVWLEETVMRMEQNREFRYEVRHPKRLPGEPAVYFYVKARHGDSRDEALVEEEVLFPLKQPSSAGLLLTVKPSSIAPGLATKMLAALATGPWDAQPDDLQRLEIPLALKDTNLLAAMGPPGANLYDLVDSSTLGVVQGFGDCGAMFVRFRDGWCAVSSTHSQTPFRLVELIARIRPLL